MYYIYMYYMTKKSASPCYFDMYPHDTHREETLIIGGRGLVSDWRVVPELFDASDQ